MFWNYHVKYAHLLPSKAIKLAKMMEEHGESIGKDELKQKMEEHEALEASELDRLVFILVLSKNLEIKDGKAHIIGDHCGCEGVKNNPFREWEKEAKRENSDYISNIVDS